MCSLYDSYEWTIKEGLPLIITDPKFDTDPVGPLVRLCNHLNSEDLWAVDQVVKMLIQASVTIHKQGKIFQSPLGP